VSGLKAPELKGEIAFAAAEGRMSAVVANAAAVVAANEDEVLPLLFLWFTIEAEARSSCDQSKLNSLAVLRGSKDLISGVSSSLLLFTFMFMGRRSEACLGVPSCCRMKEDCDEEGIKADACVSP